jgi:hypothetical protein
VVGFAFGLACGAIVLGWPYNKTESVLAVAAWHTAYNLGSASATAHGSIAATVTTMVIAQAATLFIADVITHGRVPRPVRTPALRAALDPVSNGVQLRTDDHWPRDVRPGAAVGCAHNVELRRWFP